MSRMNIVLVNAQNPVDVPYVESSILHQHLGIAYLKSMLVEKGYSVKLIDCDVEDIDNEQAFISILAHKPRLVGFTATWTNLKGSIALSQRLKQIDREIFTVIGGHHVTLEPSVIQTDSVDFLVRGEGEFTILELVETLENDASLHNILGLTFKENGHIVHNPPRPVIQDLDALPFPARDPLPDFMERVKIPLVNVCTSRGCPFNCSYCTTPTFYAVQVGKRWRGRSATNVVDELEWLHQEFGVTYFLFADDNFIGPRGVGQERAAQIAEEILRRGLDISFVFMCRADSFEGAEDIVPLLKKAGLCEILVGIESGNECDLKVMKKRAEPKKNYYIAKLLRRHDIVLYPGFINFTPYTTIEDLRNNAELMFKIKQAPLMTAFCHKISLFPGTPLFNTVKRDNMVVETEDSTLVSYEFKDQRVKPLVAAMARLYPHVLSNDKFLVAFRVQFIAFKERLKELRKNLKKLLDINRLEAQIIETDKIYEKMNEVSYDFVSNSINLAEEEWSDEKFDELSAEYLQKSNLLMESLKKIYVELENALGPPVGTSAETLSHHESDWIHARES